MPVCKNRFEQFARIFSKRHKQTTFSDAGFLGILRVKCRSPHRNEFELAAVNESPVFEPLRFHCIRVHIYGLVFGGLTIGMNIPPKPSGLCAQYIQVSGPHNNVYSDKKYSPKRFPLVTDRFFSRPV